MHEEMRAELDLVMGEALADWPSGRDVALARWRDCLNSFDKDDESRDEALGEWIAFLMVHDQSLADQFLEDEYDEEDKNDG
jgi:hypothetical protein